MGKEYWYWGGKSSKRGREAVAKDAVTASAGCMCAVFQLFDFQQFQLPNLNQEAKPSFKSDSPFIQPQEPISPKGIEAPRNSLKSDEGTSLSSIIEEEEDKENFNLNIPAVGIQIKTNGGSRSSSKAEGAISDFSSETSSSPSTKTPSLVARLMGLDLLPETNSPTFTPPASHSTQNRLKRLPLRPRQPQPQTKARQYMDTGADLTNSGTRSLPETPRISLARRSDVDYHPRLSLQINKENNNAASLSTDDLDFSKLSALRRKQLRVHEDHHYESSTRSPGHYARQIVKQVKESVSRKVGLDITNTCRNREYQSKDELGKQLKSKKVSKVLAKLDDQACGAKNYSISISNTSCSPRLRFADPKTSSSTISTTCTTTAATTTTSLCASKDQITIQISRPLPMTSSTSSSSLAPVKATVKSKQTQERGHHETTTTSFQKSRSSKKAGREGFSARLQKMQEETFVRSSTTTRSNIPDKKCKKTPLSNNLLNFNVPTLFSVKKSPISHKQATVAEVSNNAQESKRRSSQLSSSQSQKYQPQTESHVLEPRDTTNDVVTAAAVAVVDKPNTTATSCGARSDLHQYISRILFRTGIVRTSHVSFTNWFSPSHPLDQSIFHRLENSFYLQDSSTFTHLSAQFRLRSNRRLVFDVIDEILVEILKPHMNLKPWINTRGRSRSSEFWIMHGSQLIDTLCLRVESFPNTDCQVLEDIDGLIDRDLPQLKVQSEMAYEEEGEGLVMEIERDILHTILHETTMVMVGDLTYY
ncbi:uncharacterized protein LOC133834816 [Humulus lupulus]|uniref:uncharacterized protein LOC133834816 n=1 Tax=Humulus lupulus TaxID=3486 RepID=UPI002B416C5C|nr:uncharacterized protein LOC133834816 [Humulus lupulus]